MLDQARWQQWHSSTPLYLGMIMVPPCVEEFFAVSNLHDNFLNMYHLDDQVVNIHHGCDQVVNTYYDKIKF
jgi:hypothetical protein